MKQLHTLVVSLAALGAALALHAETYVRAGAGYFAFTNSAYEDKGGATLAFGTALGAQRSHQLELEIDLVVWKADWTPALEVVNGVPLPTPGSATTIGDGHLLPVLLGYRFRTGNSDSVWRFYVGANLGATHVTGDVDATQALAPPYGHKTASISSWRATVGGAAGVEVRLAAHLTLDLGYRYREVNGPTVTLHEVAAADVTDSQDLGHLSAHVATLSLGWTF